MARSLILSGLGLAGFWACIDPQPNPATEYEDLSARAARLVREHLIIDTHIDVPYRMQNGWEDISMRADSGDFDYVRARE